MMTWADAYTGLEAMIFLGWWFVPLYLVNAVWMWKGHPWTERFGSGQTQKQRLIILNAASFLTPGFYVFVGLPLLALLHLLIGIFGVSAPVSVIKAAGLHTPGAGFLVWIVVGLGFMIMDSFLNNQFGVGPESVWVEGRRKPAKQERTSRYSSEYSSSSDKRMGASEASSDSVTETTFASSGDVFDDGGPFATDHLNS